MLAPTRRHCVCRPAYDTAKRRRLQHAAVQTGCVPAQAAFSVCSPPGPLLLGPPPPCRRPWLLPLPMRCALSMACSSVVGFHHRSISTTWLATVRFTPRAAALRDTWGARRSAPGIPKAPMQEQTRRCLSLEGRLAAWKEVRRVVHGDQEIMRAWTGAGMGAGACLALRVHQNSAPDTCRQEQAGVTRPA